MRRRLRLLAPLLGAALLAALTTSAIAYFSAQGLGNASAAVSSLSTPTISSATPAAGGTVSLAWSAATGPESEAVKYYVSRDGGEPGGNCATPGAPAAALSCIDREVPIGTHTYAVIAVWRSWSTTSGTKSATVTVGAVTHFTIAAATATPVVGAADNLTITAKDENNVTVSTYAGSHSLVFSGASSSPGGTAPTVANSSGTAVAFGSATAITFTSGVATVSSSKNGAMKLYRAGLAKVGVAEGTVESPTPVQVTASPGAPSKLTIAAANAAPVAATGDALTITAVDAYGNVAVSYDGTKSLTFSGASASPSGSQPTVSDLSGADVPFGTATAIEFDEGVAACAGVANGEMTLYKSGATSVKASDGTLTSTTAVTVTVASSEAAKLVLTGSTGTPSATGTSNLTTTAQDQYGNAATGYTGTHEIVYSGPAGNPGGINPTIVNATGTAVPFGSPVALTFKSGVATVSSSKNGLMKLVRVGETSITATDRSISTAAPLTVNVLIGTASKLAVTSVAASAGSIASTCLFTCPVTALGNGGTVTAKVSVTDASGNTVSEIGSEHTVKVTSTGGTIVGTPLTLEATGPAVTATTFTYTAPASGSFTNTITVATLAGTLYGSATITASK